jgi:hypothetical protein
MREQNTKPNRRFPIWGVILSVIAFFAMMWLLLGWPGRGPEAGTPLPPAGMVTEPAARVPIRDLDMVLTAGPEHLLGRRVELDRVRVIDRAGERALWVGRTADARILVALDDPDAKQAVDSAQFSADQLVRIEGSLVSYPGTEAARERWGVQWGGIPDEPDIYILARVVAPQPAHEAEE